MKRGAKICLLAALAVLATAVTTFLLMSCGLATVSSLSALAPRAINNRVRGLSATYDGAEQASSAADQRVTRRSTAAADSPTVGCGVDRSFAPQCVDVEPEAYKLHRSVQAVGRMVTGSTTCSGVLLGNKTSTYFLTAASCLSCDSRVESVQIELTNCIGSQVFTPSELVHVNRQLDFAVLRLATRDFNIAGHFGFLLLRPSGPVKGEAVLVPHYTAGSAKRITAANDQGPVRVQRPNAATTGCSSTNDEVPMSRVQFQAAQLDDTAVGAPVISARDYSVVALQLCGGCKTRETNMAVPTTSIVEDLLATDRLIPSFITA